MSDEVSDSPAGNGGVPFGASSSTHLKAASSAQPGGKAEEQAEVAASATHLQNELEEVLTQPEAESCPTPESAQQLQQTGSSAAEQTAAEAESTLASQPLKLYRNSNIRSRWLRWKRAHDGQVKSSVASSRSQQEEPRKHEGSAPTVVEKPDAKR